MNRDDRVRHRDYGLGTVVAATTDGTDQLVLVRFDARPDRPKTVLGRSLGLVHGPRADGGEAMVTHPAMIPDTHQAWTDRTLSRQAPPVGSAVNLVNVTPALAQQWIDGMRFQRQRPIRERWVDFLASEMVAGRFRQSNIDIRVCGGCEYLINGQHRLHAVVRSGLTVPMIVVRSVSADMDEVARDYASLDRGLIRTHRDGLSALGAAEATGLTIQQVQKVSAAAPLLLAAFRASISKISGTSTQERNQVVLDWARPALLACATIGESNLSRVKKLYNSPIFSVALVTFAHAPDRAEGFWGRVIANDGLRKGSGEQVLLDSVLDRAVRPGQQGRLARAAASAWNAAYQGRSVQFVKVADPTAPIRILGTPLDGKRHLTYEELMPREPLFG